MNTNHTIANHIANLIKQKHPNINYLPEIDPHHANHNIHYLIYQNNKNETHVAAAIEIINTNIQIRTYHPHVNTTNHNLNNPNWEQEI